MCCLSDTDPDTAPASHWHPLIVVWELRERAREWNGWLGLWKMVKMCDLRQQWPRTLDNDSKHSAAVTHGSVWCFLSSHLMRFYVTLSKHHISRYSLVKTKVQKHKSKYKESHYISKQRQGFECHILKQNFIGL